MGAPSVSSTVGEFDARDCVDRSYLPDSVISTWELMEGLDHEDGDSNFTCGQNPRRSIDTRKNTNSRIGFRRFGISDEFLYTSDCALQIARATTHVGTTPLLRVREAEDQPSVVDE
ncbi:hypothetical protein V2J09_023709 [Rumex salicifolius]